MKEEFCSDCEERINGGVGQLSLLRCDQPQPRPTPTPWVSSSTYLFSFTLLLLPKGYVPVTSYQLNLFMQANTAILFGVINVGLFGAGICCCKGIIYIYIVFGMKIKCIYAFFFFLNGGVWKLIKFYFHLLFMILISIK